MSRREDRDVRAASLMVEAVAEHAVAGQPWLVVGESTPLVSQALNDLDAKVSIWNRKAGGHGPVQAMPNVKSVHALAVRLPRSREGLYFALNVAAARMTPGRRVWLYGANDEGIRSAGDHLEPLFFGVRTVLTQKHCRLWTATRTTQPAMGELDQHRRTVNIDLPGGTVPLASYPGVFAKGTLDPASEMLLQVMQRYRHDKPRAVLDFACGAGVLSLGARQLWPDVQVDGLDADAVAVEAARVNLPGANLAVGDGWGAMDALPTPKRGYDFLFSNPPLHRGRDLDLAVLESLVVGARQRLYRGGALVFVTQKQRAVSKLLEEHLKAPKLLLESGQFRVWEARA